MKFYTNVCRHKNDILYRGIENGRRVMKRGRFKPTLYVKTPKAQTGLKTIGGTTVSPIVFNSMSEASKYLKENQTQDGYIQGTTRYVSQFIYDNFPSGEIEYQLDKICTMYIDIETTCEDAFPLVDDPVEQITVVTLYDTINKKYYVFTHQEVRGCKSSMDFDLTDVSQRTEEQTRGLQIIHRSFPTEKMMLENILAHWKSVYPDIVTGWNNDLFDIPYLITRMATLLTEEEVAELSPWGKIDRREVEKFNKMHTKFAIYGISICDYMDVYKKFTQGARASYKLGYIAELELGKTKIDYDEEHGGAMHLFYKNDYKKFVEYNIVDVALLVEMEEQKRMLELAIYIAYWTRVNFDQIFSPVQMIESVCFNHMLNKGIVFPPKHDRKKTRKNKGAHVKPPLCGKHDWVVSFDVTSLYPSLIMQQNISPEMLVDQSYRDFTVEDILDRNVDLSYLKQDSLSMCGNGWAFRNDHVGLLPEVIQRLFAARQSNKQKMLEADRALQQKGITTKEKRSLKQIKTMFDIRQNALKILLNSFYGAFANEGFIFFDMRLAEAVTYTGQVAIRWGENAVNAYLNKLLKNETPKDYVIAIDTDSLYITLSDVVNSVLKHEKDPHKITQFLDNVCQEKIDKVLSKAYRELSEYLNAPKTFIEMKREVIASRGIWTGKKHYALNVYDKEKTRYDKPQLKLTGIETVKSSTPQVVRDAMTSGIEILMNGEEEDLLSFVENFKQQYNEMPVEDISYPRGINEIDKWETPTGFAKGTPIHVKGSLAYNKLIKQENVAEKYPAIKAGDKIKFVYLVKRNPCKQNVISFADRLPPEFDLHEYVDRKMMLEKSFIKPLESLASHAGWHIVPQPTSLESCLV